jgi:hypothetical protein
VGDPSTRDSTGALRRLGGGVAAGSRGVRPSGWTHDSEGRRAPRPLHQ